MGYAGYFVVTSSKPNASRISMHEMKGWSDGLYFLEWFLDPANSKTIKLVICFLLLTGTNSVTIINVRNDGIIVDSSSWYNHGKLSSETDYRSIRPVVALNEGITIDAKD